MTPPVDKFALGPGLADNRAGFRGMFRVVRFTVRRSETAARRAPPMLAAFVAVIATGSVMAAPGLLRHDYAVRFALPETQRAVPLAASPAAREAPLAEIAAAPEPAPSPAPEPAELAVASSLPVPTVARTVPRGKVPGVIALSYSLAGGASAGDAIEVEKAVTFRGADAGRIALRIDGNAKVFALGSRLAAIIAEQSGQAAVPEGLEQDFVSLEALRALGIGVKYDAIRDRLVLDPPAA